MHVTDNHPYLSILFETDSEVQSTGRKCKQYLWVRSWSCKTCEFESGKLMHAPSTTFTMLKLKSFPKIVMVDPVHFSMNMHQAWTLDPTISDSHCESWKRTPNLTCRSSIVKLFKCLCKPLHCFAISTSLQHPQFQPFGVGVGSQHSRNQ